MTKKPTYEELKKKIKALRKSDVESRKIVKALRKTEAGLIENISLINSQYMGLPIPTYTWKKVKNEHILVGYNDAAMGLTQGKIADFKGLTSSQIYKDMPEIQEDINRCMTEKVSISREMPHKTDPSAENKYLSVMYTFVPPDLVLVHVDDITERKKAEEKIQENEKKYQYLFKNAPVGIYEVDLISGRFINVNDLMCKYSGYSKIELLSLGIMDLLTNESKKLFSDSMEKLLINKQLSDKAEYNIIKKDGETISLHSNNNLIFDKGEPTKLQGTVHDLTSLKQVEVEKKRVQNIIAEYEKLSLIGQKNTEMAHNFNNILEIILGNTELSLDECEDEKTIETLKIIFEQTMRGKDLTKKLVSFANAEQSKQKIIEISKKTDQDNEENAELSGDLLNSEKYILLTEDETAIANLQYRILTKAPRSHNVDIANNGQLAIDLFDKNKYNLVSLDYILPGNIDGMDVYNHIRKTDKDIPIMFISGSLEFIDTINKLKHKDANIDHIVKPCHNKDYINSMNRLLARAVSKASVKKNSDITIPDSMLAAD